jgi:chlorophyll/bacteriochlorophyll a synthase
MRIPTPATVLELLKPVTWFPPMWAFGCGVVSAGVPVAEHWAVALAGVAVVGPMVCGTSQAANDWFDRRVDAINEPSRPIPSGRMPGRWGLYIAIGWTAASLLAATALGTWGFCAAIFGLLLAWAYSAPPLRLKRNGWWGNAACGLCYEGLPWITGWAIMVSGGSSAWRVLPIAALYSIGAHGIMTLNDFKSIEGDRQVGIQSLPVRLGVDRAARVACAVMALPQFVVVALLVQWHWPLHAACVGGLLAAQVALMRRFIGQPRRYALWYSACGVSLYVAGMLISAFALRQGA